ncbi:MAG: anti-sigma factor [Ferruginibacter sp.]
MDVKEYISSGHIEAYVMGLCTEEEKTATEKLRLQYPEINEAIIAFENELEKQFVNNPSPTSAALDDKILNTLQSIQTPAVSLLQAPVKRINWLKPVAAAAVLLLAGSVIFNYTLYNKTKQQEQLLAERTQEPSLPAADYSIMKNPAITPVAMYGVGIHSICRCTLFWDKKSGKAYIMIHHLQPSAPGNTYQLWAMVDEKLVSVGLVDDKIRDRFIEIPGVPAGSSGFHVTLEKAGGSSTPTENETYLIGRI